MVSERSSTTWRLCSTIRTVRFFATVLMSAEMRVTSSWVMPAVGSSSSIISGSRARVVAISSARLRPYGSSTAVVDAKAEADGLEQLARRAVEASSTRSERQKSNEAPRRAGARCARSRARVRCGKTAEIWNERTSPRRAMSAGGCR
jgi:hypothetical protein